MLTNLLIGAVIGAVIGLAIQYYKKKKDQDKQDKE